VRLAKSVLFCHTVCCRVQAEIEAPLAERNRQQHGASPHEISHGVQPVQMAVGLQAREGAVPNDVLGPSGMQSAVVDYGATPALVAAGSAARLDSSGLSALMASGNIDAMVPRGLYGDEPSRRTLPFCLHMFMASRLQAHSRLPFSNDSNDSNDTTLLLCTALCAGAILDCLVSPASQGRHDCSCYTARHFIMMQACMQGGRACTMTQG
jgi:hypothetical protein